MNVSNQSSSIFTRSRTVDSVHHQIPRTVKITQGSGPRRRRRRRVVSFGDATSSPVPTRSAYTEAEKKSIWYSGKELRKLRKNVDKVLLDESELDESQDCWRGLEYWKEKQDRHRAGEDLQSKIVMLKLIQASQNKKKQTKKDAKIELSLDDCKDLEGLGEYLNGDAIRLAGRRAAQDLVEAYSIYLETIDTEEVDASFHLDDSRSRPANGSRRHGDDEGSRYHNDDIEKHTTEVEV